jgi:ATP synthase protein I
MASPDPKRPVDTGGAIKQMALAFQLPFTLVAPVLLGGAVGYFLDRWLHTKPYLMLVLGILGVVAGIRDALKSASAEDKKSSE